MTACVSALYFTVLSREKLLEVCIENTTNLLQKLINFIKNSIPWFFNKASSNLLRGVKEMLDTDFHSVSVSGLYCNNMLLYINKLYNFADIFSEDPLTYFCFKETLGSFDPLCGDVNFRQTSEGREATVLWQLSCCSLPKDQQELCRRNITAHDWLKSGTFCVQGKFIDCRACHAWHFIRSNTTLNVQSRTYCYTIFTHQLNQWHYNQLWCHSFLSRTIQHAASDMESPVSRLLNPHLPKAQLVVQVLVHLLDHVL